MHRWLVAGALYATEYPASHVKSHDWPAEPLHVVGELASDDDSQPTISQEPPRNHLSDPQTWLPLAFDDDGALRPIEWLDSFTLDVV